MAMAAASTAGVQRVGALRAAKPQPLRAKARLPCAPRRSSQVVRAGGFIGSTTNLIMIASTTAFLAAGRFGLAPTANAFATAGLKLTPQNSGLKSGDPSGFTAVDTLALGAMGHVVGVGAVLGLKAIGAL